MYKLYALALCAGIGLLGCSKDKQEAIPANTVTMKFGGLAVSFIADTAVVYPPGARGRGQLQLFVTTADTTSELYLELETQGSIEVSRSYESHKALEHPIATYTYQISSTADLCNPIILTPGIYRLHSPACRTVSFKVNVKKVDQTNHIISGTFSGFLCNSCDTRSVSEGKFSVPYIVKP